MWESKILEGTHRELAYSCPEKIMYLCRTEHSLYKMEYKKEAQVVANARLCQECFAGKHCRYEKIVTQMQDFKTVDEMRIQLISEQICPFKYHSKYQAKITLGTHNDALRYLHFKNYDATIMVFEEAHDLSTQMELAASTIISSKHLRNVFVNLCDRKAQGLQQQLQMKANASVRLSASLESRYFKVLLPMISFQIQVPHYLKNCKVVNMMDLSHLVEMCTKAVQMQQFIDYYSSIGVNLTIKNDRPAYQAVSYSNYNEYLDDLYELMNENGFLLSQFYDWFVFIKKSFDNSQPIGEYSQDSPPQQQQSVDLSESIQVQDNGNNFKLVVSLDKTTFSIFIFNVNAAYGFNTLLQRGVKSIFITTPYTHPHKIFETEFMTQFQFEPSQEIQSLPQIKIMTELATVLDFSSLVIENILLQLGQMILKIADNCSQQILVLFASNSLMQKAQEIWLNKNITQMIQQTKSLNWLKMSSTLTTHSTMKDFLIRQSYLPQLLITIITQDLLDQLQDIPPQNKSLMIIQVGVPWASRTMYNDSDAHFNAKIQWLAEQKSKYDKKYFSLVHAIRSTQRLITLSNLHKATLIACDSKFIWKQLWRNQKIPETITEAQLINSLKREAIPPRPTYQQKPFEQPQQQQQQQQQPQQIFPQRKMMLSKYKLGNVYITNNEKRKSAPLQDDDMGKVMGFTPERSRSEQGTTDVQSDHKDKCPICWQDTENLQMQKQNKCGHVACKLCWAKCLAEKLECPLCRQRTRERFLIDM